MRPLLLACGAAVLVAGCGGGDMARIKGKLVENGQPVSVPGQAALVFIPAKGDGKTASAYACQLNKDGTFELVASGGEVPPGPYLVSLEVATGKAADAPPPANPNAAPPPAGMAKYREKLKNVPRELRPGVNELVIDVANPAG